MLGSLISLCRMANIVQGAGVSGEFVIEFRFLDPSAQEIINAAVEARNNAYCPYSKFAVGAAVRATNGQIFTGCNIEASSFSPTICAERVAISKAVSEGQREFNAIAVVAYQEESFTSPCGVCRQFMSEFAKSDFPVYIAKPAAFRVLTTSVHKLLPLRFVSYMNN